MPPPKPAVISYTVATISQEKLTGFFEKFFFKKKNNNNQGGVHLQ